MESMSAPDKCPFLGSVILQASKDENDKFCWNVIDGQQRLTTLNILMCACYDELSTVKDTDIFKSEDDGVNKKRYRNSETNSPWAVQVENPFYETTSLVGESGYREITKLRHNHSDRDDFEKVMSGEFADSYSDIDPEKDSRIKNCYRFFRNELKGKIDTVRVIWNYLTQKISEHEESGSYLVFIELGANENEQQIFDTINTAGERLTSADTIKNTLFQRYIEVRKDAPDAREKAVSLCEKQWDDIFNDPDNIKFWEKIVGKQDNIENLLYCIAQIKGFYTIGDDSLDNLPKLYKNYIAELAARPSAADELEKFINQIADYARLYQKYFNDQGVYEYDPDDLDKCILRLTHISNVLGITAFYPYILYLVEKNDSDLKEKLLELEQYLILEMICKVNNKSRPKECAQLLNGKSIADLIKGNKDKSEKITKKNFYRALLNMKNDDATLLLFWVELFKRHGEPSMFPSPGLDYHWTLEHIMPQKWDSDKKPDNDWPTVPIFDKAGNQTNDKKVRNSAIFEIGNMMLLRGSLNTAVGNSGIIIKIEGKRDKQGKVDEKKRGINYYAGGVMITTEVCDIVTDKIRIRNNNPNQNTAADPLWCEKDIYQRTEDLSDIIYELWGTKFL